MRFLVEDNFYAFVMHSNIKLYETAEAESDTQTSAALAHRGGWHTRRHDAVNKKDVLRSHRAMQWRSHARMGRHSVVPDRASTFGEP